MSLFDRNFIILSIWLYNNYYYYSKLSTRLNHHKSLYTTYPLYPTNIKQEHNTKETKTHKGRIEAKKNRSQDKYKPLRVQKLQEKEQKYK